MFLQIILTILVLLALLIVKICWSSPRKQMQFYQKQLAQMKYRSLILPYKLFYNHFFDPIEADKKKGDPHLTYKTIYPNYDIVLSNVFQKPFIELISVDFIKDFFSYDKHYDYPKVELVVKPFRRLTGQALGLTEGTVWKHKRTILSNMFSYDFLSKQTQKMARLTDECFKQMQQKFEVKQDQYGKYVQIHLFDNLFMIVASRIITSSILGLNQKYFIQGIQANQYVEKVLIDMMQFQLKSPTVVLGDWFFDLGIRKIDKSLNRREHLLREWGEKIVEAKVKDFQTNYQLNPNVEVDDLIKSILIYKKEHKSTENDSFTSVPEIFSDFLGFFFAGTDTTSNYLNMMVSEIARNPQIEQKLREEIQQYMKDDDYSYENLKKFKYIDALQKQTTRTYGPANIILLRQAIKDNYVNGLAIKKGTLVSVNSHGICYSSQYYKDPFTFKPERWLTGECDNIPQFAFVGFGAGARTCLGKQFALLESKIVLIKFIKRYKKIRIPNKNFKMDMKFMCCPQSFKTKLTINQQ